MRLWATCKMGLADVTLAVVGSRFDNRDGTSRRQEIEHLQRGDFVALLPEPDNPADANAIAVFSHNGVQIGYLAAERAPWITRIMARGNEVIAVLQESTDFGAYVRVSFDGSEPDLPPIHSAGDSAPDWYPDEIYPD